MSNTKTLVIYTYYQSKSAKFNLKNFCDKAISERENIDFIIVINGKVCSVKIPSYKNVVVLKRENKGFDFGGHNHALEYIGEKKYDYYFFLNNGVTGPILPHYFPKNIHWTELFINKINEKVKLVGTTIVCLPKSDKGGFGPKVEGFFFMTDQIGLDLVRKEGTIFYDHETKVDAILNGEYALSKCILSNGYQIDCMLHRYQGIDWSNKKNWKMNKNIHPSRRNSFYGKSINPYEVVFHKYFWHGQPTVQLEFLEEFLNHS